MKRLLGILLLAAVPVSAQNPAYGIVKGVNQTWPIVQCYNGSTLTACTDQWFIGSGTTDPVSGYGSDGDLFWRTDLKAFRTKTTGVWGALTFGTTSFPLLAPNGTPTTPPYGFASNLTAGLYYDSGYYMTLKSGSLTGVDQLGGATQIYPGNGTGTAGGGSVYIGACPAVGSSGSGVGSCVNNAIFHSSGIIILGNVTIPTGNGGLSQWYGVNAANGQTDKNGGGIAMRGGQSTGTGTGGGWSYDISPPAASTGTALNGFQNAISVNGGTGGINVGNILISSGVPTQHNIVGNRSGATDTVGGAIAITGGAATNGNANGGDVTVKGGAGIGTGVQGYFRPDPRAFASLGTPSNGAIAYCSDCTIANPCASGGSGALAKRLNSVWVCN